MVMDEFGRPVTRPSRAWAWLSKWAVVLGLAMAGAAGQGCAEGNRAFEVAAPERDVFEAEVWPVLVRDCGFPACHGDPVRFFYVAGPGHARLDAGVELDEPVTEAELQRSYDRARSLVNPRDPEQSQLLTKPLEVEAGGALHEGTDSFGRDVYRDADAEGYRILRDWVLSIQEG